MGEARISVSNAAPYCLSLSLSLSFALFRGPTLLIFALSTANQFIFANGKCHFIAPCRPSRSRFPSKGKEREKKREKSGEEKEWKREGNLVDKRNVRGCWLGCLQRIFQGATSQGKMYTLARVCINIHVDGCEANAFLPEYEMKRREAAIRAVT